MKSVSRAPGRLARSGRAARRPGTPGRDCGVKSPVIVSWELMTDRRLALLRSWRGRRSSPPTTMSQPSSSWAPPAAMRTAWMSSGRWAMRTWVKTAPPFCARPVMSSDGAALALQMRGHAQQRADGDDAGAADAGDEDAVGLVERRQRRLRQRGEVAPCSRAALRLRSLPPWTVTKLGQKPLTQEKSLLQEDWSIARLRPNSVSTGITDRQLDCTPQSPQPSQTSSLMNTRLGGIGHRPALAPPPLLGGAGLVVDDDGDAGDLAEVALHLVQIVAVMHRGARREAAAGRILVRLVADDGDALHALGSELVGDHRHVERPVHRLAAGHRHGVVVEDLVGDVDVGGDAGADRQQAGMVVGAVAEILEDVARSC